MQNPPHDVYASIAASSSQVCWTGFKRASDAFEHYRDRISSSNGSNGTAGAGKRSISQQLSSWRRHRYHECNRIEQQQYDRQISASTNPAGAPHHLDESRQGRPCAPRGIDLPESLRRRGDGQPMPLFADRCDCHLGIRHRSSINDHRPSIKFGS